MESTGKYLMVLGGILFAIGLVLTISGRIPFRLGRLPGDLAYERNGMGIYIPITTMLIISIVLSLAGWIVARLNR